MAMLHAQDTSLTVLVTDLNRTVLQKVTVNVTGKGKF